MTKVFTAAVEPPFFVLCRVRLEKGSGDDVHVMGWRQHRDADHGYTHHGRSCESWMYSVVMLTVDR